jgi:serine phosphatase RsbU (regulator of sigma subunit)
MNSMEFAASKETAAPEKAPSLPSGFAELREKINALVKKPLGERFSNEPQELARLTTTTKEELESFIKNFSAENDGRESNDADIEKYKRGVIERRSQTLFESELMKLLLESSLLAPNESSSPENEVFDKPFKCANKKCLEQTNLVSGVYRGHDPENLSGDQFRITRRKTGESMRTDMLLIDAEGHGGGAAPLALLAALFLEAAEKEDVEHPLVALDTFIASLPLARSEISLQRAVIESRDNDKENIKTLSLTQAGEMYAFWLEGDKDTGWKMKIIMPESNEKQETVDMLELEEGSQMGNVGYGTFERTAKKWGIVPHAQTFSLPKDAGVFFSSDGIFDAENPKDGKRLVEELPKIVSRVFKENTGKDRRELEENIFKEIQETTKTHKQTDDETFLKIAA